MELALILVLIVIAELVVSVWMLAKHRTYLKRVNRLERNVRKLAEVLSDMAEVQKGGVSVDKDVSQDIDIASLVAKATPEDIAQAQTVLAAMGIKD